MVAKPLIIMFNRWLVLKDTYILQSGRIRESITANLLYLNALRGLRQNFTIGSNENSHAPFFAVKRYACFNKWRHLP